MIELKSITLHDLLFAHKIRNICRESFFNQKKVNFPETVDWFRNLKTSFFIILLDGERVGTISVKDNEVGNVAILPKYRRKGILTQTMEIIEKRFGSNLCLEVRPENKIAIKAYEKLGFVITKIIMEKK